MFWLTYTGSPRRRFDYWRLER